METILMFLTVIIVLVWPTNKMENKLAVLSWYN